MNHRKNERLIALVRENPALYNTRHEDYAQRDIKDPIWERIAQIVGLKDGSTAKLVWFKLRSCHRDALRRRAKDTKNGITRKQWRYDKQMSFLLKHMTKSACQSLATEKESHAVLNEVVDLGLTKIEPEEETVLKTVSEFVDVQSETVNNTTNIANPVNETDDLYHFFMSMYGATKGLPTNRQIMIKRQIFNLVTDEQERCLSSNNYFDD